MYSWHCNVPIDFCQKKTFEAYRNWYIYVRNTMMAFIATFKTKTHFKYYILAKTIEN